MGKALASPGTSQVAALQIALLLFYQSTPVVSSPESLALHKHQSFCQEVGSTFSVGIEATPFYPSVKSQTPHAPSLLDIQSLRWPLSPCLLSFL